MADITRLLESAKAGDRQAAGELLPLVYDELRKLAAARMAGEKPGQTLQPTALVHEAYIRLTGDGGPRDWDGQRHFFAAAAEAMRRILVENARRKKSQKHGGGFQRRDLDPDQVPEPQPKLDLLALDAALHRLAAIDPAKARLVELRYFAGMTGEQAAAVLGMSASGADRAWVYARAWLRRELGFGIES
jgi:RNA polymerase sigma factor (TIGR02999 family)